jgi:hypothetical protein
MFAAHHLDLAIIKGGCAEKTTLAEAQEHDNLWGSIFLKPYKKTSPIISKVEINEKVNEAISEYELYEKCVDMFNYNKKIVTGFAKWYAKDNSQSIIIWLDAPYIRILGRTILKIYDGLSTFNELSDQIFFIKNYKELPLSFNLGSVKRSFIKAVWKYNEIEEKVESRELISNPTKQLQ